jgi:hypothetical protein
MFCNNCGKAVQPGSPFCAYCGRPVSVAFAAPVHRSQGRVGEHIGILAALWLVLGAITLFFGFFLLAISDLPYTRFYSPSQQQTIPFEEARNLNNLMQGFFLCFGIFFIAHASVSILAAWGLLQRKHWARMLTLILAFLALLSFPLGTALGIYTIWVLLAGNGEHEYNRLVAHASH